MRGETTDEVFQTLQVQGSLWERRAPIIVDFKDVFMHKNMNKTQKDRKT